MAACGGATPRPDEATPLPDAEGGGEAAVVVAPPPPDLFSLVPAGADLAFFVRVDLVRGSSFAPVIAGMLRDEGVFRDLEGLGVDPLQDVDRLLIAGREQARSPDVVAFEHRWSDAQVLEIYARASDEHRGAPLESREMGRFRVVSAPEARVHLIVLSPTLAALAPPDLVPVVLGRAEAPGTDAGDAGRRLRGLDALAPDLAATAALRASATNPQGVAEWSREAGRFGVPSPSWGAGLIALDDGATAFGRAGWGSEFEAQSAERSLRAVLTQTLHPAALMLRVMGLARALEASQITQERTELTLRTHLTAVEVQRVLARLQSPP